MTDMKKKTFPRMKNGSSYNSVERDTHMSRFFLRSIYPQHWMDKNHDEGNACWHGCDKVSTNIGKVGGGGGS